MSNHKWLCGLSLLYFLWTLPALGDPAIKSGDRITFLGGTFVERMQIHGHFEAEIRTRLDGDVTVKNLGWAGDNVLGESRAVFGTIEKGMERLVSDMELTNPTVIIICYGANEAHAGREGIPRFKEQLHSLCTKLARFEARLIFVAPRPYETLGPPLPAPDAYNNVLLDYSAAIAHEAAQHNAHFVDLASLDPQVTDKILESSSNTGPWILEEHTGLTSNGVHLTSYGYWRLAGPFADALELPRKTLAISIKDNVASAYGFTGVTANRSDNTIVIEAKPDQLQLSPLRKLNNAPARSFRLTVGGLPKGKYQIASGDQTIANVSSRELADGIDLSYPVNDAQVDDLRNAIISKNMMFFHRHRPQNETYLFLFRKHEQGNNATEVPEFDPIVEDLDRRIYELSKSRSTRLTVSPLK